MKRTLLYAAMLLFVCCTPKNEVTAQQTMTQKLYLTINGTTMSATLVDNSSTQALVAALQTADIVYEAHDYGNFEKVGPLGQSFPQNNEDITTKAGDTSEGIIAGFTTPSYAGYLNAESELQSPVWYIKKHIQ